MRIELILGDDLVERKIKYFAARLKFFESVFMLGIEALHSVTDEFAFIQIHDRILWQHIEERCDIGEQRHEV